ncbi:hypothetical protein ACP70R_025547 [Stipagrostis hirtigluma subsp. patula]
MSTERGEGSSNPGAGAKRVRAPRTSDGPATEAPPPPPLPVDLQLEVVARTDDAATVLRCAAANKPLRGAILGPGFRRLLALRAAANGGFDPALLVAVSYQLRSRDSLSSHIVVQPSRRLRLDTTLPLRLSETASTSRDALLVLRRKLDSGEGPCLSRDINAELRVVNTFTGHVTSLPCMDLRPAQDSSCIFWPTLLTVDGAGRSFELLAMDKLSSRAADELLRTQTFLSHKGEWGDVREVHLPLGYNRIISRYTAPVVIGRTVHWLCNSKTISLNDKMIILALQADAAQAMAIELPQGCLRSLDIMSYDKKGLILATTADGTRLSLVVAEGLVISMWTLTPDNGSNSWSRQVVIRRRDIDRQVTTGPLAYQRITFQRFGGRSGTVLFWMHLVGLVQINLATKKALVVRRDNDGEKIDDEHALLHEIDLVSLLQGMRPF